MSADPTGDLVSVVIPTHDRRDLLPRTLRSALAQEDVDLEVIVVDDRSSDGTSELLSSWDDPRLRWQRNEGAKGACAARNVGIELARGRWVAFLDDDDLWAPGKLAAQLRALAADPEARWATAGTVSVDEHLDPLVCQADLTSRDARRGLLVYNQVPGGGSGVLAERSLVDEVGRFDEQIWHSGDWDLWVRLALRSPVAVAPGTLVAYVRHPGAMSTSTAGMRADFERIRDKYEADRTALEVRWPDDLWDRYIAETHLRAGRRRDALSTYWKIFRGHRHWSWMAMGLVGTVAPRTTMAAADRWERHREGVPEPGALTWLDPYREPPVGPDRPST